MTLSLFDTLDTRTMAHRNGPETSRIAARSVVASGRAATHAAIVMHYVRQHPSRTSAELAALIPFDKGIDLTECGRRLTGLLNAGRVIQGPQRTCGVRKTKMVTWDAVEE